MLHNQSFGFEVLWEGRPLREYLHTDGKTYVAGEKGGHYSLRLTNRTGRRVLFICTVDGLSIMDGKPGDLNSSSGYVVHAGVPAEIPGWRLSDEQVAAFVFGGPEASYAAQMGKPRNIGVIGCAVFEERPPVRRGLVLESLRGGGESFGGDAMRGGLGTGFGDRVEHHVSRTQFDRQGTPACVLTMQYDTAANLRKKGVPVEKVSAGDPDPFPATSAGGDGCPPPKGWESGKPGKDAHRIGAKGKRR